MDNLFPGKIKKSLTCHLSLLNLLVNTEKAERFLFIYPHLLELSPLSLVSKGVTRSFNLLPTSCQATGKLARAQGNSGSQSLNASLDNEGNSTEK